MYVLQNAAEVWYPDMTILYQESDNALLRTYINETKTNPVLLVAHSAEICILPVSDISQMLNFHLSELWAKKKKSVWELAKAVLFCKW